VKYTITTTEKDEAMRAVKALDLCTVIYDFEQTLRGYWKHGTPKGMGKEKFIDKIWEEWHDNLYNNGIIMNELYN